VVGDGEVERRVVGKVERSEDVFSLDGYITSSGFGRFMGTAKYIFRDIFRREEVSHFMTRSTVGEVEYIL